MHYLLLERCIIVDLAKLDELKLQIQNNLSYVGMTRRED